MFKIIRNNEIHMTRGDTARFSIVITAQDGSPYTMVTGDNLYMTVRQTIENIIVLQKLSQDGSFVILPSNTANLPFGCYVYDISLVMSNGEVNTIVIPSLFELCGEVTY